MNILLILLSMINKGAELVLSDGGGDILISGDANKNEQTILSGFIAPGSGRQHSYIPDKCK